MRNVFLQLAIIAFFCVSSFAQTTIGDSVITTGTTIFYKSKSPYILNGTINVKFRGKLVVEPGVTLIVDKAPQLLLDGPLVMVGTATDSIWIKSKNTNMYSDFNIQKGSNNPKLTFNYVNISYFNSLCNSAGYSTDSIANSYIHHCKIGIAGFNFINSCFISNCENGIANIGGPNISNTKIKYCNNGLIIQDGLRLSDSEISYNQRGILDRRERGRSMSNYMKNNKINNNRLGMELYTSVGVKYGNFVFTDNEIMSNDTGMVCLGEYYYFNGEDMIAGTKICNNKVYNFVYPILYKDVKIAKVCWCTNDSLEIKKKIYDGHTENSDIGYVTVPDFIRDCAVTDGLTDNLLTESEENFFTIISASRTITFKYAVDDFEIFAVDGFKINNVISVDKLIKQVNAIEAGGLFLIRYKYNNQMYTKKVFL